MVIYDGKSAECFVYSYKEGVLSKIAHDLKCRATRFVLCVDEEKRTVEAEIDARSLRVDCVMLDGKEVEGGLSEADKRKIESQIMQEVLNANAHPLIRFYSTSIGGGPEGLEILGMLELNNCRRPIVTVARRVDSSYQAEVTLNQPAFGIKPFSAMLGTLRIKPDVRVRMVVPVTA